MNDNDKEQSRLKSRMAGITKPLGSVFQSKKKALVVSGAAVAGVLVTMLCVWAVMLVFSDDSSQNAGTVNTRGQTEQERSEGSGKAAGKARANILRLETFEKIPLQNSKTMGYLNLDIALELSDPGLSDLLNRDIYDIRQMIKETAGKMSWFELRSPEGKINLKYRLIEKINSLYTGAVVQNLYFTSFLMQ